MIHNSISKYAGGELALTHYSETTVGVLLSKQGAYGHVFVPSAVARQSTQRLVAFPGGKARTEYSKSVIGQSAGNNKASRESAGVQGGKYHENNSFAAATTGDKGANVAVAVWTTKVPLQNP